MDKKIDNLNAYLKVIIVFSLILLWITLLVLFQLRIN
jgi:hypothetical protein